MRDSQGRDTRIHGLVLDDGNPARSLRELLRQWSESGLTPPGDLAERTKMVLDIIGPDGVAVPWNDEHGHDCSLHTCWRDVCDCGESHG